MKPSDATRGKPFDAAHGKHVAVLMGGWSAERDISLRSGKAVAKAARESGHKVTEVNVNEFIRDRLFYLKPDLALNMLHGPFGEDGGMQKILEELRIPYSHSGVQASGLAMNKARARDIFKSVGVPVASGMTASRFSAGTSHLMRVPYVVKPVDNGSSVGVYIIRSTSEPPPPVAGDDWQFGERVLLEEFIPGHELTCAVMGKKALGVIEIVSDANFYDFNAKYSPGGSKHILPAEVPEAVYKKVQEYALAAHRSLGCRGVSRSDFRYDPKTDRIVCLEVNTQPGMTETSLVPEMAAYAGYSFQSLVDWMIADTSLNR